MPEITQIQVKNTVYDLRDATARSHSIPGGGKPGQFLKKNSTTPYDTIWATIEVPGYTATRGTVGSAAAGTAISADDITSWNAGSTPTLGTAIAADDITSWNAGTTPTLGTAISADDITAWDPGSAPTLGTAIPADDITAWNA